MLAISRGKWPSSSSFSKLYACIALVYLIFFMPKVECKNARRKKADKNFRIKKGDCERVACGHMIVDEAQNCINKCISAECYEEVYAHEPLEDGEVDASRYKRFQACYRAANKYTSKKKMQSKEGQKPVDDGVSQASEVMQEEESIAVSQNIDDDYEDGEDQDSSDGTDYLGLLKKEQSNLVDNNEAVKAQEQMVLVN
uniref:Uncharacterized protein n=1 Tax=Heterosigma akashiwo TaxID=2829 RepID=A0A6S9GZX5_HETAK|mmetsp:Transcript_43745/g.75662  ORF Transcript_43745/g.75662 Transcript_43745/m.75662 type:complete len:198 (+) Transcript_43745:211-804(+)